MKKKKNNPLERTVPNAYEEIKRKTDILQYLPSYIGK